MSPLSGIVSAVLFAVALLAPGAASAQTVGSRAVTALQTLCGPYMAGTPFDEAAANAGFDYDTEVQEYYFGVDGAISTTAQADPSACRFVVYFTEAEGEELLLSLIGFADSIGGSLTRDGDRVTDAEFQYWITEWEADAQTLTLTEMRRLDDTRMVEGVEVMVVTLRRAG